MTQTNKASLKATKAETTKPSKVVYILNEAIKTALHNNVTMQIVQVEKLTLSRAELFNKIADSLGAILEPMGKDGKVMPCTVEHWDTVFSFVEQDLINTRNILPSTAKTYISELYKLLKARDIEKPRKQTASAVSMAKAREAVASIPDATLAKKVEEAAKAGDFKEAAKLASEVKRREKAKASEAKKAEAKDTSELRNGLKKWVSEMNSESLAALLWVRNNWADLSSEYQANKVKKV